MLNVHCLFGSKVEQLLFLLLRAMGIGTAHRHFLWEADNASVSWGSDSAFSTGASLQVAWIDRPRPLWESHRPLSQSKRYLPPEYLYAAPLLGYGVWRARSYSLKPRQARALQRASAHRSDPLAQ